MFISKGLVNGGCSYSDEEEEARVQTFNSLYCTGIFVRDGTSPISALNLNEVHMHCIIHSKSSTAKKTVESS